MNGGGGLLIPDLIAGLISWRYYQRISKETLQICKRQIKKRTRNALPFMDLVPLMKFFLFKEIKT